MTSVRNIVFCSFLSAILIVSKEVLAQVPNVELVSFLLIMYTMKLGRNMAFQVSIIFCIIQVLLYGFNPFWTPTYFVIWPLLVIVTAWLKPYLTSNHRLSLLSAIFGLLFGLFSAIPYLVLSLHSAIIYFLNGIIFDVIHAISNYIVMTILYDPLEKVFDKIKM